MEEEPKRLKNLYGFEVREPDKRRNLDGSRKIHDCKMLWQRQHEILGLALGGMSNKDIAAQLGITPVTVSHAVNGELGMKKLSQMRKERDGEFIDVAKKVEELSEKALKIYEEIFDSETISYELKKKTADTVTMDLGGHRAPTVIDSRSVEVTATMDELDEFKRLGHKAAKDAGFLIELPEGEAINAN